MLTWAIVYLMIHQSSCDGLGLTLGFAMAGDIVVAMLVMSCMVEHARCKANEKTKAEGRT